VARLKVSYWSSSDCKYLVADDVGAAEGRWLNEAVVLVLCVPAGSVGVVVHPLWGGTGNGLAVGGDALDVAVSRDGGHDSESCEDGSGAGGIHLDRHEGDGYWCKVEMCFEDSRIV
jgi:hypothetical protein